MKEVEWQSTGSSVTGEGGPTKGLQAARMRPALRSSSDQRYDVYLGDYKAYDPGVTEALGKIPRAGARAAYRRTLAATPRRRDELARLMAANGLISTRRARVSKSRMTSCE